MFFLGGGLGCSTPLSADRLLVYSVVYLINGWDVNCLLFDRFSFCFFPPPFFSNMIYFMVGLLNTFQIHIVLTFQCMLSSPPRHICFGSILTTTGLLSDFPDRLYLRY